MGKPIEALVMDAEGVVIDTMHSIWIPADIEFLQRKGFTLSDELMSMLAGTNHHDAIKIMQKYHGFGGDVNEQVNERFEIIRSLFREKVKFIDGFLDFHRKIQEKYKICIATSLQREFLNLVDRQLGLSKLFRGNIFNIQDVDNKSKPDPALFLYAARQLGVDPVYCVVIEDAPRGIEAAARAGMRSIGLATTFPAYKLENATFVANSYKEIDLNSLL